MSFEKDYHEGIVSLYVECTDPEDIEYNSGKHVEEDLLRKYELKPGDGIQYRILKSGKIKVLSKVYITKKVVPI